MSEHNDARFWESTPLDEMTGEQWEALCDGCGLCCHVKLLDDEDPRCDAEAEVFLTKVSCRLLDRDTCRCSDYANRKKLVPECLILTPENIASYANWLPSTCGYRRLYDGKALPDWHPLLTGEANSVHRDGPSFAGRLLNELMVPDEALEDCIVPWPAEK